MVQPAPAHGASLPAARRSSARGIAPSRTSRGMTPVQSTSVDGGTLPSTPPSSTSSSPLSIFGPERSASRSAPGAGGWPGRLAEVEVSGRPERRHQPARCRRATCAAPRCRLRGRGAGRAAGPRRPAAPASAGRARTHPTAPAPRARTPGPTAPPWPRLATSSRNGLSGGRPLSRPSAVSAATVGRRSRARRRSRWDRRAGRRDRDARRPVGIAVRDLVRRCGTGGSLGRVARAAPRARGPLAS